MLCLRRISLDAKSRLLFLSRSHSSTNDSMPKSTAISRLIHKKFLQQNGNNSPQAIFVFFQQRGIRTKADKEKSHAKGSEDEFKFGFGPSGMKPKNEWEKGLYRILHNLDKICNFFVNVGYVIGYSILGLMMYTAWKYRLKVPEFKFGFGPSGAKPKNKWEESLYRDLKESFVKLGKSEQEFKGYLESIDFDQIQQYSFNVGMDLAFTYMNKSADHKEKSDAKDSEDEFKFGIGPFGAKPKNNFEKDLYRYLHKDFMKSGKSEEEFEIWLKLFDLDQILLTAVTTCCLTLGVILASMTFIVSTIFVEPIVPMFFVLFIALPVLSFFGIRAFLSMT
ncbi:hypothetical protein Ddc_16377 [Ditylenchus destructor]|nr:hypothetical protein Ddc_16377 [Ditylenchus destructor]